MSLPEPAATLQTDLTPIVLEKMAPALGDAGRIRILRELAAGEPLMVKELAARLGKLQPAISRHVAVLREAGMVEVGRGGLYQIPVRFLVDREQRVVDYGGCLLRLKPAD